MENRERGFTVIELSVAICVGLVVTSMAVMYIVSLFSSSTAMASKQVASQNARQAMTSLVKDVASAQSLMSCSVWKSSELQQEYEVYVRRANNHGDDPATSVIETGTPTFSGSSADCLEYYETGRVLLRALPNAVCWFRDLTTGADKHIDFSQPFRVACLFRGGGADSSNYDETGADGGYGLGEPASMPCVASGGNAGDSSVLYYMECTYFDSSMHYFIPGDRSDGDWIADDGSYRQVLELGVPTGTSVRSNIFSYVTSQGTPVVYDSEVVGSDTSDIVYVDINMDIFYDSHTRNSSGEQVQSKYVYTQSVQLLGAKAYLDQGAYSDRFTG